MATKTTTALSPEGWCPTCGQLWLDRERALAYNAERKAKAAREARAKRKKSRRARAERVAESVPKPHDTPAMAALKADLRASIKRERKARPSR